MNEKLSPGFLASLKRALSGTKREEPKGPAKFEAPDLGVFNDIAKRNGTSENLGAGYVKPKETGVKLVEDRLKADTLKVALQSLPKFDKDVHMERIMEEVRALPEESRTRYGLAKALPEIFKRITTEVSEEETSIEMPEEERKAS